VEGQRRKLAECEEEEDDPKQSDRDSQEEAYVKVVYRHLQRADNIRTENRNPPFDGPGEVQ